ncbi:RecBCD enzyme subunit RecB OS=Castellaniella defragrans OX=75697 GN=recB PE=3 SV=1 [Castellaniella defragrans]
MTRPEILPVQPLRFELRGSRLIEASAGTGKTWTIAALYVRLVLGHGGQPARLPAQILVLTFTEAATRELRDRIRARLSQAAAGFAGEGPLEDEFLAALRAEYPETQWPGCAHALELAAQSMDEAAIFTIHGWCQRVLREHAFDSGSLFELSLQQDLDEQKRQVAWDYWRAQVAGLEGEVLQDVLSIWSGPEKLLSFGSLLTREGLPEAPAQDLERVCADLRADRRQRLQALKQPWVQGTDELAGWLEGIRGNLKPYQAASVRRWLDALRAWAADPEQESLDLKTGWDRLTPDGVAAAWQGEEPAPRHPRSEALALLRRDLDALPALRAPLTRHALGWMAARLRRLLASTAVMGFDGLLTGLATALDGGRGPKLAHTLRLQFPVALIDEFQDTDPLQYRIFDRIYEVAGNDPECAVVLIGDPKQAIYGFRGADIHTYLRAARDCAGRVQTLGRNFRSSVTVVDAVNRIFEFSGASPFLTGIEGQGIAFQPVRAQGLARQWTVEDAPGAAMVACWLESDAPGKPLTAGRYRERAAQACAAQVARLLALARAGRAGFGEPGADFVAVRPADLAILVNTHDEAHSVRAALGDVGVRSVYLSERESVYESSVAEELGVCLRACAHPEDERAVRAALATPLLGLSAGELQDLAEDESAWDGQVERFQAYHRGWRERGVLPALRHLLHEFGVPARLLAEGHEGERRLTDCLHLAELLQQASLHLDGEQALLRYLQREREASTDEDARHLRLESDEDRVRVVTVHKSKGLEYPLVFLPFVCAGGAAPRRAGPVRLVEEGRAEWVIDPDEFQAGQIARERLGEEVRKFYVALTRARDAVWLALGNVAQGAQTGVGHVLGGNLRPAWESLVERSAGAMVWGEEGDVVAAASDEGGISTEPPLGPARELAAPVVAQPWWIASYSALRRQDESRSESPAPQPAPQSAAEDVLREARIPPAAPGAALEASAPEPLASALGDFPRGGEAGTFLHGLLEWAGQRNFRELHEARDVIARRCQVRGWEAYIDHLHQWLLGFAAADWPLDLPDHPVLRFEALQGCRPEMEFWLPVADVEVSRLDRLITGQTFGGRARPALAPAHLNGMFKGFIDLSLCLRDRYYLVDYKSNDLGPGAADYAPAALAGAMCAARYDVQMMMYVLALHRQLRARLPGYDYERDMGGAVYLFLRGQEAPGQGLLAVRPPRALIDALDALFSGRGEDSDV